MKALMIQGTSSGAGKSTIVAALCSLLRHEGYSVTPFKTQNMSLNSYVARRGGPDDKGGEMAVAQAVQAIAAGEEPSVDMNPILLKPRGNLTSSLIIYGKWVGDFSVNAYYENVVSQGLLIASHAMKRLSSHDFMIIEGAGSPAEINLYDRDIANMRTAELVDAPVVIVGDIERGGVFASLYGTYFLLPENWRHRVKGFIINKMGGDPSLLGDGPSKIEKLTGVPVLGVIPYESDVSSWSEDSLDVKNWGSGPIKVAVVRYPGASILTDVEPLRYVPDVSLVYATTPEDLKSADIVVMPGSKSTRSDLRWMREKGIDETIMQAHREGKPIVAICGGAQMIGSRLVDPLGLEGEGPGEDEGLSLLPHTTIFSNEKVVRRNAATDDLGGRADGFEIHKGRTSWETDWKEGGKPLFKTDYGWEGCHMNNVYATLIHHAVFYDDVLTNRLLEGVRQRKELPEPKEKTDPLSSILSSVAKAEELLRKNVDVDKIMEMLEVRRLANWKSALAFLTIIPVKSEELDFSSFYLYPLIEGGIGLASAAFFLPWLGLPRLVAAALSLATAELVEGFNHLDGLIDAGDAWMARATKDPKRMLEIMRDKFTGTGALAFLTFTLIVTVTSLSYAPSGALAMSSALASFGILEAALVGTPLNDSGLGDQFIKTVKSRRPMMWPALLLTLVPSIPLFLQAHGGLIAFLVGVLIFPAVAAYFNRAFKFTNGDVLGAAYEIDRALALVILLITLRGPMIR
ncbi:MAG: cobyric acid synthase [Thermoprotei archaeon]